MNSINEIAIAWLDEANKISVELSKTLMTVSATLLMFSTAIVALPDINTNNPFWMYRIPWILMMLSLMSGVCLHLLKSRRLRALATGLLSGRFCLSELQQLQALQGGVNLRSRPSNGEQMCIILQPMFLLLGLTSTGISVLW